MFIQRTASSSCADEWRSLHVTVSNSHTLPNCVPIANRCPPNACMHSTRPKVNNRPCKHKKGSLQRRNVYYYIIIKHKDEKKHIFSFMNHKKSYVRHYKAKLSLTSGDCVRNSFLVRWQTRHYASQTFFVCVFP